ncbi:MAG: hypothetical protein HZY75_13200 [Nocardioidaceae bacterium]|nr:MAG: hypothetical protein HZY75_13200 [Nocardioidaceae bacterium]
MTAGIHDIEAAERARAYDESAATDHALERDQERRDALADMTPGERAEWRAARRGRR